MECVWPRLGAKARKLIHLARLHSPREGTTNYCRRHEEADPQRPEAIRLLTLAATKTI